MRGQIFDALVRLALLVGAVEILQRKGDVVGSRCSSSTNSGVKVSFSAEMNSMTPTTLPPTNSGNARA